MAIKSITADVVRSNYESSIKNLDQAARQLEELAVACIKHGRYESAGIMLYGMVNAIKDIQLDIEGAKSDMQSMVNGGSTKSVGGKRFMSSNFNRLNGAAKRLITSTKRIAVIRNQQESALKQVKP